MIQLTNGLNQNIIFTLTEKSVLLNPNYLFQFKFDQTNEVKLFFAEDYSLNKARYNMFNFNLINDINNEVLTGGTPSIYLKNYGFYSYSIFETTGNTLSTSGLTEVEFGRVNLQPSATTSTYYTTSYNKQTIKNI